MAASSTDIEDFLNGPLIAWLSTCVRNPDRLQVYESFFDGWPFSEVLLQIDPEPTQPLPTVSAQNQNSVVVARTKVFLSIFKSIKQLYEEELQQVVIASPDCVIIGKEPNSLAAIEQLKLLLLLLLGCAVQGPTKEKFIARIKELALDLQHDIVECIKQITESQTLVLTYDWTEQSPEHLYAHVRTLVCERDAMLNKWVAELNESMSSSSQDKSKVNTCNEGVDNNHLAVELADMKAKLRKQRQELEEKSELLTECKEEVDHVKSLLAKLRTENSDLLAEVRKAKLYRDEADAMREKAEKADRLEMETQRYKERLADAEFYRVRVEELREDNRVLLDTREMLETQLTRARQRADRILELEAEIITCKRSINEIALERDAAREKIQELMDENLQLQQITKLAIQEAATTTITDSEPDEEMNSGDNSLSEQLTNNAQARTLKLELENRRLLSTIESLKEGNFHETSNKLLETEKEKKRFSLKCDQLQRNVVRLTKQNEELENLFKNALQENKKLQETMDAGKAISDRQIQELQSERQKVEDLEKSVDSLAKEKQRINSLYDSVKKRADDAEKMLSQVLNEIQILQMEVERGKEREKGEKERNERIILLEKENCTMQKEITKLRELLETKDVILDEKNLKFEKQVKEIIRLNEEKEMAQMQIEKLQEYEHRVQELLSQTAVYTDTIATLQKDLVSEKITNEKFKTNLEKLGLNLDILDNDVNVIIEKMLDNPDISNNISSMLFIRQRTEKQNTKCPEKNVHEEKQGEKDGQLDLYNQTETIVSTVTAEWNKQCEKLTAEIINLQQTNEALQAENAQMKVDLSTLTSKVNSLTTQQTALQLANSQLVVEKEELINERKIQIQNSETLLLDQTTLRTLHEQLSSEYEQLKHEMDQYKKINRDLKNETRFLKDSNAGHEKKLHELSAEKDALRNESKSLINLRAEHSKLKDDFKNLFTASERLKTEYRMLQEEYKKLRAESGKLRLGHTEMQDADRRALMDHVSQLLSQYHSLLTHSLEDKEQFHMEEKQFTDKLNNLCRQKEKLEEKIMEHYRKLDNASAKKKGFGATLVRRVRKAGSDIMNKVPSRNRRSWHEDNRLTQSQFTLAGGSGGESGGNDSDNSMEETGGQKAGTIAGSYQIQPSFKRSTGSLHIHKPRDEIALRRSQREFSSHRNSLTNDEIYMAPHHLQPSSAISLGSVGSRRTVYLSEDEPASSSTTKNDNVLTTRQSSPPPPLLVYNKISTVYGEPQRSIAAVEHQNTNAANTTSDKDATSAKKKSDGIKETTATWYEYGCV
ncbi:coiled-coil domain-containing protein 88B isoform X2 [Agrilus planipennis]|uniref:Coiled-coil domain-containing protein 88B isoform X2 n=1 Tax=Agrilus planipennis TaxID=224129 RepID=A0A1W4WWL9_AGRPL|nr:coiled-coil domain-containing protein 88B isoform X2 [Agrilus planipennis]